MALPVSRVLCALSRAAVVLGLGPELTTLTARMGNKILFFDVIVNHGMCTLWTLSARGI